MPTIDLRFKEYDNYNSPIFHAHPRRDNDNFLRGRLLRWIRDLSDLSEDHMILPIRQLPNGEIIMQFEKSDILLNLSQQENYKIEFSVLRRVCPCQILDSEGLKLVCNKITATRDIRYIYFDTVDIDDGYDLPP